MVVGQTYFATHFQYRIIGPLMLLILLWRSIDAVGCEILPPFPPSAIHPTDLYLEAKN